MKHFYEVTKQLKKISRTIKKDIDKNGYPSEYQLELIKSAKKLCRKESQRYQIMASMLDKAASEYENWETIYQKSLHLTKENKQDSRESVAQDTISCQPEPIEQTDIKKIKEQAEKSTWGEFLSEFGIDLISPQTDKEDTADTDKEEPFDAQKIREQA